MVEAEPVDGVEGVVVAARDAQFRRRRRRVRAPLHHPRRKVGAGKGPDRTRPARADAGADERVDGCRRVGRRARRLGRGGPGARGDDWGGRQGDPQHDGRARCRACRERCLVPRTASCVGRATAGSRRRTPPNRFRTRQWYKRVRHCLESGGPTQPPRDSGRLCSLHPSHRGDGCVKPDGTDQRGILLSARSRRMAEFGREHLLTTGGNSTRGGRHHVDNAQTARNANVWPDGHRDRPLRDGCSGRRLGHVRAVGRRATHRAAALSLLPGRCQSGLQGSPGHQADQRAGAERIRPDDRMRRIRTATRR